MDDIIMIIGCELCGEIDKREDDIGFYDGWYHKECWIIEDMKMRPSLYMTIKKKYNKGE